MKNSILSLLILCAFASSGFTQTAEEKDFATLDSLMKVIEKRDSISGESSESSELDLFTTENSANEDAVNVEEACVDLACSRECDDRFAIHWKGLDIGVNGFLTPDNSTTAPKGYDFLELNYGRSFSFGLNMLERNIPLYQNHVTLVTGLGVEFNNYSFNNNTTLRSNDDSIWATTNPLINFPKNKLKTTFIEVPLLLGFNTSENLSKSLHIAVGVVFGYKLNSKTKQKYEFEGTKYKPKVKSDFNIQPFRYSATARMGYGNYSLFAEYALTPMFEKNRGPELHPFSVGITLKDI